MDFESAVQFLKSFNPYEDKGFPKYNEKNFNLDRLRNFLKVYKIPGGKTKFIHVTGSKGKSSVCRMAGDYLWKKGYKVGVFTSPYIVDITESIWVNGRCVSKNGFAKYVFELKKIVENYKMEVPTYFELLTAIVLRIFADAGLDFAIIEVGLGGRLDATNVIEADLAVITTVEKEHADLLGKTYGKILNEKLGIAVGKNVKNLIVGWQTNYVRKLIQKKTREIKNVIFVGENNNSAVVSEILKNLFGSVDRELFQKIVKNFKLVGRMDVRKSKGKTIVFDMAHTKNSVKNLLKNLREKFPKKTFLFLVSIMKNKNLPDILIPISKVGKEIILTSSNPERGFTASELGSFAKKMKCNFTAIENFETAYSYSIKKMGENNVLVVTGSHFLIGKILERFF